MSNDFISAKEMAKILRVSKSTVYREIREGKIPSIKLRGQYRVLRDVFEEHVSGIVREHGFPDGRRKSDPRVTVNLALREWWFNKGGFIHVFEDKYLIAEINVEGVSISKGGTTLEEAIQTCLNTMVDFAAQCRQILENHDMWKLRDIYIPGDLLTGDPQEPTDNRADPGL